jgi:mycothiol S-conjugate amidase
VTLRLLAVHAHPDDESSKGAGTLAYYRSRGARVLVVSCTGGERGSVLNAALDPTARVRAERDMAGLRRQEMSRARDILDIEHRWLGFCDSGLPEDGETIRSDSFAGLPVSYAGEPLVRIVRDFRPHVLLSYDENGGYPHPDHIRAHEAAVWAKDVAADADALPEFGAPWSIPKHYYDRTFSLARMTAVYESLKASDPANPRLPEFEQMLAWRQGRAEPTLTTRVPCGDFFETRDAALRAHASQVAPDDSFFFWPNDLLREAWPTEDFELVSSSVATTLPESDLFAGIADEEDA